LARCDNLRKNRLIKCIHIICDFDANIDVSFSDLRINNTNKKQDNALEKYRIATFLVDVT